MCRPNESEVLGEHMNSRERDEQSHNTADAVARRSYGKLVAFLGSTHPGCGGCRGRAIGGIRFGAGRSSFIRRCSLESRAACVRR